MNRLIKQNIDEIEAALCNNEKLLISNTLSEGLLGLALFYYYYYLLKKDYKYLIKCTGYIEQVIQQIENRPVTLDNSFELFELARVVCFLVKRGVLDQDDALGILSSIDRYVKDYLEYCIKNKNLDSIDGVVCLGYYFLDALEYNSSYTNELNEVFKLISDVSQTDSEGGIYWRFNLRDKNNPYVEFSFFHGIAGVLNFLVNYYEINKEHEVCRQLISNSIHYLSRNSTGNGVNYYKLNSETVNKLNYQNLTYGDIGIGFSIFNAGSKLANENYKKIGLDILVNSALYRDEDNKYIRDADFLYGSAGLFAFFEIMEKETSKTEFNDSKNYWLRKTLQFNSHDTEWAGYDTYINGFDADIQLCFSHGICGIGIALISHYINQNHEYITFFNYR